MRESSSWTRGRGLFPSPGCRSAWTSFYCSSSSSSRSHRSSVPRSNHRISSSCSSSSTSSSSFCSFFHSYSSFYLKLNLRYLSPRIWTGNGASSSSFSSSSAPFEAIPGQCRFHSHRSFDSGLRLPAPEPWTLYQERLDWYY